MRRLDPSTARAAALNHAILDVRCAAAFREGHAQGGGNIPFEELAARRAELPPRDHPLLVVAEDGERAVRAAERVEAMGYADVSALDAPCAALSDGPLSRSPAARLWRPAPFLEWALARHRGLVAAGPAADIAAGAGRDAVFLALAGFEVDAFDHDAEALASAERLATRAGVHIRTVKCDLERADAPLPEAHYALIVCFRFLHRPLLPRLAAALAPGGVLIYETYRVGQERFGRPKSRRFLLESGELPAAFPDLEVVHAEEPETAAGPITARLIARRP